jgi:heme o synthase
MSTTPRHPAVELTRARLSGLVVATTLAGYVLASPGRPLDLARLAATLAGTALAAAGASALNQWMERDRDAVMRRTRLRPLPAGLLAPRHALAIGLALVGSGLAVLAIGANLVTALLALAVEVIYLGAYTPLKPRSPLNTMVGAVCGALPPMMGWTAATGGLGLGAWILGALLFLWQVPHFLSLAWLYREDYERAGFRMLPVTDPSGRATSEALLASTVALIPLCLAAPLAGLCGSLFVFGSLFLGVAFAATGFRLRRDRSRASARRLFLASLIYLPLVLGLMVLDRGPLRDPAPSAAASVADRSSSE